MIQRLSIKLLCWFLNQMCKGQSTGLLTGVSVNIQGRIHFTNCCTNNDMIQGVDAVKQQVTGSSLQIVSQIMTYIMIQGVDAEKNNSRVPAWFSDAGFFCVDFLDLPFADAGRLHAGRFNTLPSPNRSPRPSKSPSSSSSSSSTCWWSASTSSSSSSSSSNCFLVFFLLCLVSFLGFFGCF